MNFKLVLRDLLTSFQEQHIRYALIGGFALGLWGVPRATVDLDFLALREDMERVHKIMTLMGYVRQHYTENVSQYLSLKDTWGGVDFLHAFREASREMLHRAVDRSIFGGELQIKTLIVEDIIGLKLQSLCNNPLRAKGDMDDIEQLVALHRQGLDWDLLQGYFTIFAREDLYQKLLRGGGNEPF